MAGVYRGLGSIPVVLFLVALEGALSFDNAVVNAGVLRRLNRHWQLAFLTLGVVIAVVGMRVLFPLAIVAVATSASLGSTLGLALGRPEEYARHFESASPSIGSFGGVFLLLLALTFFLRPDRSRVWLGPVERALAWSGRFPRLPVLVAGAALLALSQWVSAEHSPQVLLAGLAGMLLFLLVRGAREIVENIGDRAEGRRLTGWSAAAAFLYLEALDASFSLDGVLGAFAMTSDIVIVGLGLGAGALYVRSLTVYLVRERALRHLPYLTSGAHWAILTLAVSLLVGTESHPPEWLTGGVGVAFIGLALVSSLRSKEHAETSA